VTTRLMISSKAPGIVPAHITATSRGVEGLAR
jgi:hypothetical protein